MTRSYAILPLLAIAAAAPLQAQEVRDFQLPPSTSAPADARTQGPVDPDAPVTTRPRAAPTERPAPVPTPSPAPAAAASPNTAAPRTVQPAPTPSRALIQPRPTGPEPVLEVTPSAPVAQSAETAPPPVISPTTSAVGQSSAIVPQPVAPVAATAPDEAPLPWLWIALGGLAIAAAGAAVAWRRRTAAAAPPEIVAPFVPAAAPAPVAEALAIAVQAVRMDRSLMNATVNYRVTVRNRTANALNDVAVQADLVSASGDRPAEQQLASPAQALTPRHAIGRLAPGQSVRLEGQVRLPLAEASAIWQGRVGLLVPLLRVRAIAEAVGPVATTLVIGRSEGQAARPQPFRFDEPPRSYAPLAQRVLDAVPARA